MIFAKAICFSNKNSVTKSTESEKCAKIFLVSQAKLFFISIDDDIVDKTFKVEKNFDALSHTFCIFDFFLIQNFVIGRQTAWCF